MFKFRVKVELVCILDAFISINHPSMSPSSVILPIINHKKECGNGFHLNVVMSRCGESWFHWASPRVKVTSPPWTWTFRRCSIEHKYSILKYTRGAQCGSFTECLIHTNLWDVRSSADGLGLGKYSKLVFEEAMEIETKHAVQVLMRGSNFSPCDFHTSAVILQVQC